MEEQSAGVLVELTPTWPMVINIWWSYLWRNLIAMLVSFIVGGIIGGILGFILGSMGVPINTIKIIVMPIGFILGLGISIFPMKMIIGKNFKEFRLIIVENK